MVTTKEILFSWEKSFNLEFNDILMVPNQPTIKLMRIHFMDEQLSLKSNYFMIDYYINYMWSLFFVLDDLF